MLRLGENRQAVAHGFGVPAFDPHDRDARGVHERPLPHHARAVVPQQTVGLVERLVGMAPGLGLEIGKRLRDQDHRLRVRRADLGGQPLRRLDQRHGPAMPLAAQLRDGNRLERERPGQPPGLAERAGQQQVLRLERGAEHDVHVRERRGGGPHDVEARQGLRRHRTRAAARGAAGPGARGPRAVRCEAPAAAAPRACCPAGASPRASCSGPAPRVPRPGAR